MAINVTNLRSFWFVAQHLSFTRAAEEIGVSQPVLTRQVRALERDYGVVLFNRTTRRLLLTQEGYKLRDLCAPIFKGLDDADEFLRARKARKVTIHSVQHYRVSDLLILTKKNFPRDVVDVEIMRSSQVRQSLIDRECDFGILTLDQPPPDLEFFPLERSRIVAMVPEDHPWRNRSRISLNELSGQNLIVGSAAGQSRHVLDRALIKHAIEPQILQPIGSNEVIWDLVRKGYGIGVLGYSGLVDELAGHYLDFEEAEDVAITVHLACRKERLDTAVFSAIFSLARRHLTS